MSVAPAIIVMTYADHPATLQPRATNITFETTKEHGAQTSFGRWRGQDRDHNVPLADIVDHDRQSRRVRRSSIGPY
jgi:hypothetical protein